MDRPILISTPLVRPTIEGRKTVTRRLAGLDQVNENPDQWELAGIGELMMTGSTSATFFNWLDPDAEVEIVCPYGKRGDQLWVRETFVPLTNGYGYKADGLIRCGKIPGTNKYYEPRMSWKPSIHMPRKASRIDLELLTVSIERAHDIDEEDAEREGVERGTFGDSDTIGPHLIQASDGTLGTYRDGFKYTWINLNGRESWEKNPWVWRLFFKLLKCTTP